MDNKNLQMSFGYTDCLRAMSRMADKHWKAEEWEDEGCDVENWEDEDWVEEVCENEDLMDESLRSREKEIWAKCMKIACSQIVKEEYENRRMDFEKHEFSEEFCAKMEKLMEVRKRPEEKIEPSSILSLMRPLRSRRMVIVFVAAMLLLFGTTAGGTNPIIVWIYENWMEQHGDYVETQNREYWEGIEEGTFQKYELAELPEGYQLENETFLESVGIYHARYVNKEGQFFAFEQGRKDNGNLGNVTADREDLEQIEVGEFKGYYFRDSDAENLILSDKEYTIVFSGNLTKKEFIELAENLRVIEK